MPFSNGTQAEDEATTAFWRTGLVRVDDDARIEQRSGLERVFVHEVGANQLPLNLGEDGVVGERILHLIRTCFELCQQVAMTSLKVLQNIGELLRCRFGVERENAVDDVVRPRLVGRLKVPRFGSRLERAYEHSCRIGAQVKRLPVQKCGL